MLVWPKDRDEIVVTITENPPLVYVEFLLNIDENTAIHC